MVEYLQIGKIINVHGVRGEIKLIPLTDYLSRFDELEWAYIERGASIEKRSVTSVKYFKGTVIMKFDGIDTVEAAETLRNCFILVDRAHAVKLPENTYFICDIIGCTVYDENNNVLGELTDVLKTGSNDVYVIKSGSKPDILLPALKSVVKKVAPEEKRIDVIVPKGLLEDEV